MEENESLAPKQDIIPNQRANTQEELDAKIAELGMIEEEIFSGDGKIGGESNDTQIDAAYKEAMEKAVDIKTKIKLVEKLIKSFRTNIDINREFQTAKKSEYIDNKDRENIKAIEKKIAQLCEKYPEMRNQINKFVLGDLAQTQFYADYYKNVPTTKNQNNNEAVSAVLKNGYELLLKNNLPKLEQSIQDIKTNAFISDKASFINYIVQDDNFSKIEGGGIGVKLNSLFKYDFIKEGFSDDEKGPNYDDTFGYGTLVRLFDIDQSQLQKINTLYKNPEKTGELVALLDTLPVTIKEGLLSSKKLLELYGDYKKGSIGVLGNMGLVSEIPNQVIVKLGNIKDKVARDTALNFILEIKKANSKTNVLTKDIAMSSTIRTFEITDFVSDGGHLDNLIQAQTNTLDKINIIKVFESFISSQYKMSTIGGGSLEEKILAKLTKLQNEQEDIVNKEIKALKEKFKDNPRVLIEIEHDLSRTGGKPNDGISNKLAVLSTNYGVQQGNKPEEKKINEITKSPENQKLEKKMQEQGLGKKFALDENGKMVSKEYLEKKMQAVSEGKPLPPEEKTQETMDIGRSGQIKFGVDGEMLFTSSLGYTFHLDNNSYGVEKALEINDTFDYLDKLGLSYFGEALKPMIQAIKSYLPNQGGLINIDENSGDFLNKGFELPTLIDVFKNIGVLQKDQNTDYFRPDIVQNKDMITRMDSLENKGENFFLNHTFSEATFKQVLQKYNTV